MESNILPSHGSLPPTPTASRLGWAGVYQPAGRLADPLIHFTPWCAKALEAAVITKVVAIFLSKSLSLLPCFHWGVGGHLILPLLPTQYWVCNTSLESHKTTPALKTPTATLWVWFMRNLNQSKAHPLISSSPYKCHNKKLSSLISKATR